MTSAAEFQFLQGEFKSGQFVKKGAWQSVFMAGLLPFCQGIKPRKFLSGIDAIWLKHCWQDSNGLAYDWLILDIEASGKDHHSDIHANLEAGREFLRIIIEHGLEVGLIIFLSGNGLRFCWPYLVPAELQRAFRALITDQVGFSMIDPAPFTKKAFYRLFANRNHRNQGAVLNRHIHRLDSIHELWFMTEPDYLALVSGIIDLNTSLGWLQEIIPTGFIPEAWRVFLKKYKIRAMLADTIFRPIIPSRKYKKPIAFLAEQAGFEFRQMHFANGEILQLRACPICGRRDGNPYVTEGGRLKCHHQNSCAAGTVNEMGRIIGIPAERWLPGGLSDDFDPVVVEDTTERITIEAARYAMREAFKTEGDTYVTLSPGAGKSHTMIQEIVSQGTGKIAICSPEHRLNQEFYELARGTARHPEKIHFLQGRNVTNCERILKIESVARAGFSPGIIVCSRCAVKQAGNCDYYKQFESLQDAYGLWLITHAMALEIDFAKFKFTLLVIDESPLKTFLQKQSASHGAMMRIQSKLEASSRVLMGRMLAIVPMQLEALEREKAYEYDLSRIYAVTGPVGSPWSGNSDLWEVAELTPDDRDTLDRALDVFARFDGESVTKWQKRLFYKERVDMAALTWLWSALSGKPGVYIRFQKDRENPANFISFTKRLPTYSGRIICLDATGNLPEVESLFERKFMQIQGRVQMPELRTSWIKQNSGKKLMSKMSEKQLSSMMKSATEFLKPNDKKVLIVTHMVVEETVKRLAADILPHREISTCHFWGGSRGVNEFAECTAVIALGIPFPNIDGLYDHAMSLMPTSAERIKWILDVGCSELVQALHRVRPVKGDRTVIVVGRDFPVAEFGSPQFKMNRGRGDKANETSLGEIIDRLTPFVERWGFLTKEIGWVFKVYLDADKNKAIQAFEYIQDSVRELENYGYNYLDLNDKIDNDEKGTLPDVIYLLRTLIGKLRFDAILSRPYSTIKNRGTWHTVLTLLGKRFKLPKMRSSNESNQVYGIGYISSVRAFLEAAHLPPDSFKNIEGIESPEAEEPKI